MTMIHVSQTDLSDFFKDAFGFRPRTYKEWWTEGELRVEYDRLTKICKSNEREERERQAYSLTRLEKLIDETISHGAKDRETAIKWLFDAEELNMESHNDVGYFCYLYDIPYEIGQNFKAFTDNKCQ